MKFHKQLLALFLSWLLLLLTAQSELATRANQSTSAAHRLPALTKTRVVD